jgi:hypothetical protein
MRPSATKIFGGMRALWFIHRGIAAREVPHLRPDASENGDVKQIFAVGQAYLHPSVVGEQVATASFAVIGPAAGINGSYSGADEISQINCEGLGFTAVVGRARVPRSQLKIGRGAVRRVVLPILVIGRQILVDGGSGRPKLPIFGCRAGTVKGIGIQRR